MRALSLIAFLALSFSAAAVGGWLTSPGLPWLAGLNRPPFYPPNWIFGPVWTVLYAMMAVSGWRVYCAEVCRARSQALALWGLQLLLNVAWSGVFFYLRQPFAATLEILALLAVLVTYVAVARGASRLAAWLFVPYVLWVGFATVLTTALWWLNRA